jgi:hypothetical protein
MWAGFMNRSHGETLIECLCIADSVGWNADPLRVGSSLYLLVPVVKEGLSPLLLVEINRFFFNVHLIDSKLRREGEKDSLVVNYMRAVK